MSISLETRKMNYKKVQVTVILKYFSDILRTENIE